MSDFHQGKIQFHHLVRKFQFSNRNQLKSFLKTQIAVAGKDINAINFIFCTDVELLKVNRQYLNHDTYTDIVTFELSSGSQPLLSDIYISVERVRDNARTYHISFQSELHRVIFHGILHLIGFNDKTKKQAAQMRLKENEWIDMYLVPREKGSN